MRTRSLKKPKIAASTKKLVSCTVCGKKKIKVRSDGTIVGGYYFGKIPLYRKSEFEKMKRGGIRKSKIGPVKVDVYKYDPKPYKDVEYWECVACYRGQSIPLRNVSTLRKQVKQ